jgi:hypothetical protein
MSTENKCAAEELLYYLALFGNCFLAGLTQGYALSKLWGWFLTPLGLSDPPGLAAGFGVLLLCRLAVPRRGGKEGNRWLDLLDPHLLAGAALGCGWVCHCFV